MTYCNLLYRPDDGYKVAETCCLIWCLGDNIYLVVLTCFILIKVVLLKMFFWVFPRPGKYPKEHFQYSNHGESLKSRKVVLFVNIFNSHMHHDCKIHYRVGYFVPKLFYDVVSAKHLTYRPKKWWSQEFHGKNCYIRHWVQIPVTERSKA